MFRRNRRLLSRCNKNEKEINMKPEIRSFYTVLEETHADGVKNLDTPTRKAACAVVFKNPFAGKFEEDLTPLYEMSKELGVILTQNPDPLPHP